MDEFKSKEDGKISGSGKKKKRLIVVGGVICVCLAGLAFFWFTSPEVRAEKFVKSLYEDSSYQLLKQDLSGEDFETLKECIDNVINNGRLGFLYDKDELFSLKEDVIRMDNVSDTINNYHSRGMLYEVEINSFKRDVSTLTKENKTAFLDKYASGIAEVNEYIANPPVEKPKDTPKQAEETGKGSDMRGFDRAYLGIEDDEMLVNLVDNTSWTAVGGEDILVELKTSGALAHKGEKITKNHGFSLEVNYVDGSNRHGGFDITSVTGLSISAGGVYQTLGYENTMDGNFSVSFYVPDVDASEPVLRMKLEGKEYELVEKSGGGGNLTYDYDKKSLVVK